MLELLPLLQKAPAIARVVASAQRAANGDPEALAYLKSEGWLEGLDLVRPGAGETARQLLQQIRDAASGIQQTLDGNVVEGEYRVLEGEERHPWDRFVRRMVRQRHGGHIILGPVGQGKTSLATCLAWHWRRRLGYRVECVSMYGEDVPAWAVTIGADTLVHRMMRLRKWLAGQAVRDPGEPAEEEDDWDVPPTPPPMQRVIVIDEASLSMSTSPANPVRNAALAALAQCRHLEWHVLFIGQWAGMIPPGLFGQTTTWVKRPAGREVHADRDNPIVRDLWERAGAAFAELPRSPWYVPPHDDPRAWAYVDCPSLAGLERGYVGLVPFAPAPEHDVDDGDPQEEE